MDRIDFKKQLVHSLITSNGQYPRFRKRGYQISVPLLHRAAQSIGHHLPDAVDAVVALGTSGLALAVFLAQELSLPLYFYKTDGWPKLRDGSRPRVLPKPEKPLKVVLADSHYRSSYSWAKAESYLRVDTLLEPVAIGLVVDPDVNDTMQSCTVSVFSVIKVTDNAKLMSSALGCNSQAELARMLSPESKFWGGRRRPTNVGAAGSYLRHAEALLLPIKESEPSIEIAPVTSTLRSRIDVVPVSDPGIWEFYLDPDLVREVTISVSQALDLYQYSHIVGVSVLGTALGLSLVFHNRPTLNHIRVFSSYLEKRLVPYPDKQEFAGAKVLLTQMRLTSGLLANDALKLLEKENGTSQDLFAMTTALSFEPKRRQRPLRRAAGRGLERIHTLVVKP